MIYLSASLILLAFLNNLLQSADEENAGKIWLKDKYIYSEHSNLQQSHVQQTITTSLNILTSHIAPAFIKCN